MNTSLELEETKNAIINLFEIHKTLSVSQIQNYLSNISRKRIIDSINAINKDYPNLIITSKNNRFNLKLNEQSSEAIY
jgi:hypothetical protein